MPWTSVRLDNSDTRAHYCYMRRSILFSAAKELVKPRSLAVVNPFAAKLGQSTGVGTLLSIITALPPSIITALPPSIIGTAIHHRKDYCLCSRRGEPLLSPCMHSGSPRWSLALPKPMPFLVATLLLWAPAKPNRSRYLTGVQEPCGRETSLLEPRGRMAASPNLLLFPGRCLPFASTQWSLAAAKITSPSYSCRSPASPEQWSIAFSAPPSLANESIQPNPCHLLRYSLEFEANSCQGEEPHLQRLALPITAKALPANKNS